MKYLTLFITVPLTLLSVLFVVSNATDVSFRFYPGGTERILPLYTIGLVMLGGGFFAGALFVSLYAQRLQFKYWSEQKKASLLERELDQLHAKADAAEKNK